MNKLAMLMPGQGAQYIGMGKDLYERYQVVKQIFEEAEDVLEFDLRKMCMEGDMKELILTQNTQPAMLTVSYAAFKAYMEETGLPPYMLAGHSLGEISALTCAEALTFRDALVLARKRGTFMGEAVSEGEGAMTAIVGSDLERIQKLCETCSQDGKTVSISNYNTKGQTVVSGHIDAVMKIENELERAGAKLYRLKVSAPFHSPLMLPAACKMKEVLKDVTFKMPKWQVISDVDALPYKNANEIPVKLAEQIIKPVQWTKIMEFMKESGITHTLELGPGKTLSRFIQKDYPDLKTFKLEKKEDIETLSKLSDALAERNETRRVEGQDFISMCLTVASCTRNYNFDEHSYEEGVITPYRVLQKMEKELKDQNIQPVDSQLKEAGRLFKMILKNKNIPEDTLYEKLKLVQDETGIQIG